MIDLTKDQIKILHEARQHIEKAMEQNGPYSHNIVSLALSQVAREISNEEANGLIDEYELTDLYGIEKVEE